MVPPIGRSRKHHQSEKTKNNKKSKEQLVKCIPANSQQCSRVFSKGRSYFPDLHPKNIFFNDYDLVFGTSTENKLIFKENHVHQWGIFQKDLQKKYGFPALLHSQLCNVSAISMNSCNNNNSFTIRKNIEYQNRWKMALCKGQSEQLRENFFI